MSHALGCPFEQAHRITLGLKQTFQIGQQPRVFVGSLFASSTLLALSISWTVSIACFQFSQATQDGVVGDNGFLCDLHYRPALLGFQGEKMSPLFLIEHLAHLLIFLCSTRSYPYHLTNMTHLPHNVNLFPRSPLAELTTSFQPAGMLFPPEQLS